MLTCGVLGVAPETDGFRRWAVRPHPGDLRWAQGSVPVPGGALEVRWRRGAGDATFELAVTAPLRTAGRVAVPLLGAARTIAMNGTVVWRDQAPAPGVDAHLAGDAVVVSDVPSTATFAW